MSQSMPPCRQSLSRAFHSSRPNRLLFELLEPISQTIHWGFQELHTQTDLPWYATIPLGAAILRMTWIPVQIWTQRAKIPRETAVQLTSAWRKAYQETARIKFPGKTEGDAKKAEAWVASQLKARRKAMRKHNRYLGSWVEPVLAISFVPVWILSMDVIRRMAGDTRTVTSLIFKPDNSTVASNLARIEPGFDTETLYWIPSLVSPDPQWILPITFGALATISAWFRVRDALRRPTPASDDSARGRAARFSKRIGYAMTAMPSIFTFMIIRSDMATAVVLYLLGTTATQLVQRPLVARMLGTSIRIQPLRAKQAKLKGQNEK